MAVLDLNADFSAFSKVMAAETGSSYKFGCRIDINAIPTAKVGFPGTVNAWQQTGSATGCPDTQKLQMAAKKVITASVFGRHL
jgi:hypothetical protein